MNLLYLVNHLIFAIFMTMLLVEGGFAVTSLLAYKKYKKALLSYITPIWEITGTFAVFYAVNFEATFPTLLGAAGTIYAVPLLLAAALIIIRNVFLIYSAYIGDLKKETKYLRIYGIATIVALILFLSVLSSAMSGLGINLATETASIAMYLNPFNIIVVVSSLLISLSLAASIFRIEKLSRIAWVPLAVAIALIYIGTSLFVPPAALNFGTAMPGIALLAALVAILAVLQYKSSRYSGKLSILIVVFGITLFGVIQYPYILGSANITSYLATSALAQPLLIITLIGGMLVAASLSYLIYLSYLRKEAH
jgi:cytochrome d ubiquinol oxidase subunit II